MTPALARQAVGRIAAADFRRLDVLERHAIDYVNDASAPLVTACSVHGADLAAVEAELAALGSAPDPTVGPNEAWTVEALIPYIVDRHHRFVRDALPSIGSHLAAMTASHGQDHPELLQVAERFARVERELLRHLAKEEQVLFPYMLAVAAAASGEGQRPLDVFGTVQNPIRMMLIEHQRSDNEIALIRELTRGFRLPQHASRDDRACFAELEAFDADFRRHLHLENNLLFPAATALESTLPELERA